MAAQLDDEDIHLHDDDDDAVDEATPMTVELRDLGEARQEASVSPAPRSVLVARLVLVVCCVAYITASVATDAVRAIQLELRKMWGDARMGALYGAYSAAAMCTVLVAGRAIDRLGVAVCTFVFSALCVVGFVLQTVGVFLDAYWCALVGRFLHGAGGEALFVCWDVFLLAWFDFDTGRTLAIALYCASGRLGDLLATTVLPWVLARLNHDTHAAMLIALALVVVSLAANVVLVLLDRRRGPTGPGARSAPPPALGTLLRSFSWGYWLCVAVAVLLYGVIAEFQSFGPTVLLLSGQFGETTSALLVSVVYATAMVATPVVGHFQTPALRFRAVLAAASCLLLASVGLFVPNAAVLVASLVACGLGFACTSAGLWGTLAVYGHDDMDLGLLYAIPYALLNAGGLLFALSSGWLLTVSSMGTVGFWTAQSVLGVVICLWWMRVG